MQTAAASRFVLSLYLIGGAKHSVAHKKSFSISQHAAEREVQSVIQPQVYSSQAPKKPWNEASAMIQNIVARLSKGNGKKTLKEARATHSRSKSDCVARPRPRTGNSGRKKCDQTTVPPSPKAKASARKAINLSAQPGFHRRSASDGNAVAKQLAARRREQQQEHYANMNEITNVPRCKSTLHRPGYDPPMKHPSKSSVSHKRSISSSAYLCANVKKSVSGLGIVLEKASHHERSVSTQIRAPLRPGKEEEAAAMSAKRVSITTGDRARRAGCVAKNVARACKVSPWRVAEVPAATSGRKELSNKENEKVKCNYRSATADTEKKLVVPQKQEVPCTVPHSVFPSGAASPVPSTREEVVMPVFTGAKADLLSSENLERLGCQKDVEKLVNYIGMCKEEAKKLSRLQGTP